MAIPKGVRARNSPDFYAQYFSVGGWGRRDTSNDPPTTYISLYNNSSSGQYLFVYGIDSSFEFSYWATLRWRATTLGDQVSTCSRINPGIGAPPGLIYSFDNPGLTPLDDQAFATLGNVVGSLPINDFPLAVIPPGWSLVVGPEDTRNEGDQSTTFWYIPMLDQKGNKAS
jgi:hypothetical protein